MKIDKSSLAQHPSIIMQLLKIFTVDFWLSCHQGRNEGRTRGAEFPRRLIAAVARKSPNKVTSTFFNTVHWGAKLASCPVHHLASLRPWFSHFL